MKEDEVVLKLRFLAERLDALNARLTRMETLIERIALSLGVSPHG